MPYLSRPADRALYAIRSEGSEEEEEEDDRRPLKQPHRQHQQHPHRHSKQQKHSSYTQHEHYAFKHILELPSPTSVPHYAYRPPSLFDESFPEQFAPPPPRSAHMDMNVAAAGDGTVVAAAHAASFSAGYAAIPVASSSRSGSHIEGQRSDEGDAQRRSATVGGVSAAGGDDPADGSSVSAEEEEEELELDEEEEDDVDELVVPPPQTQTQPLQQTQQQQQSQREGQQTTLTHPLQQHATAVDEGNKRTSDSRSKEREQARKHSSGRAHGSRRN
jgi:hypothetical protein